MSKSYKLSTPSRSASQLILSVPHCGEFIPEAISCRFAKKVSHQPEDTDFFVDQLYQKAAADFDLAMISAHYSRYVIDLNRPPEGPGLYGDGRQETTLVPLQTFSGLDIYRAGSQPDAHEIKERIQLFYQPYHQQLRALIDQTLSVFGKVLVIDCHSIRRHVPTIHPQPFADVIVGDYDGRSADHRLSQCLLRSLKQNSPWHIEHNHPFKGGHITRHYGEPSQNIHLLQIEMSQDLYMNETEKTWNEEKATRVASILKIALGELIKELG